MNLLRIQDALKDASDQQLMQMMQAPDSTAPSYLVLSEIRRRRDMRAQQAPEGESRRTVAEELLAQDDGGIRNIVAHDEPEAQEGADEMAAGGLASLRGYREGGVVRMQTGGQPPTPLRDLSDQDVLSYYDYFLSQGRPAISRYRLDPTRLTRNPAAASPYDFLSVVQDLDRRAGVTARPVDETANVSPAMQPGRSLPMFGGEEGVSERTELPRFTPPRIIGPREETGSDLGYTPPTQQQRPGQRQAQPAAASPAAQPAAGIGALRPGNTEGAEANPPNVQFTDRLSPLFERMREGRVDPAARRGEALNMALIEAGLRIAGSRNPSLAGAIGEGATPAVQSYAQQLGQIRADQRQDLRDELQGALAQNQNDYYRGRLSQQEFATRQQMLIERLRQSGETDRTRMREAGADARNAATIANQRIPANVQELQYLENLYNTNPAAFERAMRARQTGVGAAEIRGSTAIARAVQDAIGSDRGIQMLNLQRTRLEGMQNRTEAQNQELASIRARIAAAERDIEQRFMRIGAAPGGLPISNTPTGPGGVVQAPIPR